MRRGLIKWLLLAAILMMIVSVAGALFSGAEDGSFTLLSGAAAAQTLAIAGPDRSIFEFSTDGCWWPGRIVEKTVVVKNIGETAFDLEVSVSGSAVDGSSAPFSVSTVSVTDSGFDDHTKIHITPEKSQNIRIQVEFKKNPGNEYQEKSWNVVFIFLAKQCDR